MARILLGNRSETVGKELAQLLTNRGHRVTTCLVGDSLDDVMRRLGHEFEIVILDVSNNDLQTRNDLAVIKHHKMHGGPKPMLLCVSHVYHGPRFELELELKGARLVYVR